MPQLLISVRSAHEASDALAGGADWIDIKEPVRGSLGAADIGVMRDVIAAVAGRTPVSAALGELTDADLFQLSSLPSGLSHVKFGLSGCGKFRDWPQLWRTAIAQLPDGILSVAVVYADHAAADAPEPGDVLNVARQFGCRIVLIDTYCKDRGNLFDVWPQKVLAEFAAQVRDCGLQ